MNVCGGWAGSKVMCWRGRWLTHGGCILYSWNREWGIGLNMWMGLCVWESANAPIVGLNLWFPRQLRHFFRNSTLHGVFVVHSACGIPHNWHLSDVLFFFTLCDIKAIRVLTGLIVLSHTPRRNPLGTDIDSTSIPRWFNVISLKWHGNHADSTSVPSGKGVHCLMPVCSNDKNRVGKVVEMTRSSNDTIWFFYIFHCI